MSWSENKSYERRSLRLRFPYLKNSEAAAGKVKMYDNKRKK